MRTILKTIVFALLLTSCSSNPDGEAVKGVVMRYNQLLTEGYEKQNMNPVASVATEEVATKAYYHMSALGEARIKMVSSLKKISFKEIKSRGEGAAEVTTSEAWDFTHREMDSGKTVLQQKDFVYKVVYQLEKKGGEWKITKIDAIGEEKKEATANAVSSQPNVSPVSRANGTK